MRNFFSTPARVFALMIALSLGVVGMALVTQHAWGMQPCPWCILQRLIFVSIALVAVLGVAWRSTPARLTAALGVDVLAICGVATALWQHFVAAATSSCKLTLADRIINGLGVDGWLPEIFAPRATCAEAAAKLLGVPYEFWSLTVFVILGALGLLALLGRPHVRA